MGPPAASHLLVIVSVCDSQQALGEENLKLLDKQVLGIVNADECADHIAWFTRAEL